MIGGVVADRLRPTLSVPFPKDRRHTWQPWFARSATVWRSILRTTPPPVNPEKTAEHRSVAVGQDVMAAPATACVRQSRYDSRATEKGSRQLLDVGLPASPSVQRRQERRQPGPAPPPHALA